MSREQRKSDQVHAAEEYLEEQLLYHFTYISTIISTGVIAPICPFAKKPVFFYEKMLFSCAESLGLSETKYAWISEHDTFVCQQQTC